MMLKEIWNLSLGQQAIRNKLITGLPYRKSIRNQSLPSNGIRIASSGF